MMSPHIKVTVTYLATIAVNNPVHVHHPHLNIAQETLSLHGLGTNQSKDIKVHRDIQHSAIHQGLTNMLGC